VTDTTYPEEIKGSIADVDGTPGRTRLLEAKIRDEAASQAPIDSSTRSSEPILHTYHYH
jgi:hypothetical protein